MSIFFTISIAIIHLDAEVADCAFELGSLADGQCGGTSASHPRPGRLSAHSGKRPGSRGRLVLVADDAAVDDVAVVGSGSADCRMFARLALAPLETDTGVNGVALVVAQILMFEALKIPSRDFGTGITRHLLAGVVPDGVNFNFHAPSHALGYVLVFADDGSWAGVMRVFRRVCGHWCQGDKTGYGQSGERPQRIKVADFHVRIPSYELRSNEMRPTP